jgi:hypothetical protein
MLDFCELVALFAFSEGKWLICEQSRTTADLLCFAAESCETSEILSPCNATSCIACNCPSDQPLRFRTMKQTAKQVRSGVQNCPSPMRKSTDHLLPKLNSIHEITHQYSRHHTTILRRCNRTTYLTTSWPCHQKRLKTPLAPPPLPAKKRTKKSTSTASTSRSRRIFPRRAIK